MDSNSSANKRRSLSTKPNSDDKFAVPQDTKKAKTTIHENGTSNPQTPLDNYFNDNFSQFFHTQFFEEISKAEEDKLTSNDDLNSTRCRFSQCLEESQFNDSITPGQKRWLPPSSQLPNLMVSIYDQLTQPLRSTVNNNDADEDAVTTESNGENHVQCSQIFLNGVSALQTNITSLIDETLMANRLNMSDTGDNEDKFSIFRSNSTMSEYVQLQRLPSAVDAVPMTQYIHVENQMPEVNNENDEENDILAALFMDESWPKIAANVNTECKAANGALEKKNSGSRINVQAIVKQSPVTAANFYVMGPYFGLPLKVKKLIKEFKGIDDLYGKHTSIR